MSDVNDPSPGEGFPRIRLGVSACLLGQEVRFDGGHKRDAFLTGVLPRFADFVPVCPEVAVGLGTPRPPIRLVGDPAHPRAVGVNNPSLDPTDRLAAFAEHQAGELTDICGYVLKKDSPSCGMERVRVYRPTGGPAERKGVGIYTQGLRERLPLLPLEEEGRLNDPVLREGFFVRVFAYERWQRLTAAGLTAKGLIDFHADHKLLVMAHSQAAYARLGRMLSNLSGVDLDALGAEYAAEFMAALARRVNRGRHVNVLQHILGYLKRVIDAGDKAEIADGIAAYGRGEVPLVVPITLMRHYFRRHPDPYIGRQHYLRPHPDALGLRNAI